MCSSSKCIRVYPLSQQAVVREVGVIKKESPAARLEVVIYGQTLSMVLNTALQSDAIQNLLALKEVSFKVCAFTMKRNNVDKSQSLAGVEVVPNGIYEIITKQNEGWGYIKVAH